MVSSRGGSNLIRQMRCLLLLGIMVVSLTLALPHGAIAQPLTDQAAPLPAETSKPEPVAPAAPAAPLPVESAEASKQAIASFDWDTLVQELKRSKPLPTKWRNVCLIAPIITDRRKPPVIWNERPLLAWRGAVGAIGIRYSNTDTLMWQQPISPGASINLVQYSAGRLNVGATYDWLFFTRANSTSSQWQIPFQILPPPHSILITAELMTLQRQLDAANANREEVARQRANYFAQQKLWTDVLLEMYAVTNPSESLQQARQDIEMILCPGTKSAPIKLPVRKVES